MIDNIDEYSEMWANGQNIGKLWDIIKAKFVAGYPGDGDTTSHVIDQSGYGERWFTQARKNIGLPRSTFVDDMYVGRAKSDELGHNIKDSFGHTIDINNGYLRLMNYKATPTSLATIELNANDGLVQLKSGKIPLSLFPDAIAGQMLFAGTVDEFIDHSSASPATSVDLLKVTLTDNAANKLHEKISAITTSNKVVYLTTASSSGTYNSKPMVSYVDCEGMYFLWTSNAIASGQTSREWSGERFQVGDWLVSVGGITAQSGEDGWRKIDNTDAVTSVAGINDANVNTSIYGTPTTTGAVVMNAGRVRALDTGLPNNTQTVAGNVQFNKDVWALGGLAAYGISDLTRGGGGGGGLSGSILRDWANFNPNDETQILGSNLGIEAFQMSGSKMQFKRNNAWVDGFTLQAANIPNLDLTQINDTTELRKIETLSATGTPSGFLKRASNGTWSFDTNSYALASALNDYLPLTGGTIVGSTSAPLIIQSTSNNNYVSVQLKSKNHYRNFGLNDNGDLFTTNLDGWANEYKIWHAGNMGAGSGLNADKLDGVHASELFTVLENDNDQLSATIGTTNKKLTLDYAKKTSRMRTELKADQEFVYRQSPQTIDADSLVINKFKGRTLAWNQNAKAFAGSNYIGFGDSGASTSYSDGVITITITRNSGVTPYLNANTCKNSITGHKYIFGFYAKAQSSTVYTINGGGSFTVGTSWTFIKRLFTASGNSVFYWFINNSTTGSQHQVKNPICIDLTLMFGVGNEPSTVEEFEALFPNAYYEYNAGELRNNDAKQFESEGFNLWDEEWERGAINGSTGDKYDDTNAIRSRNYISIFPNSAYCFRHTQDINVATYYYDANKNFISSDCPNAGNVAATFTTPSNAAYLLIKIGAAASPVTKYANDVCINLSDPAKNGTYEPYRRIVTDLNLDAIQVKSHNIWDEEWVNGYYNTTNGNFVSYNASICSKNAIAVFPSTNYCFNKDAVSGVIFYDINKNFISSLVNLASLGNQFTTPTNCYYVQFYCSDAYSSTYNNDICLNENSAFNGRYEPHGILTINGLKQAGSVYDEIVGNKFIQRVGSVDLGSLGWYYYSSGSLLYSSDISALGLPSSQLPSNLLSSKYLVKTTNYQTEPTGSGYIWANDRTFSTGDKLYIKDSNISSSDIDSNHKVTKLNGVILNYALATPIEYELASPIPDTMPAGTTERIISDRLPVTPFACDMTYGANPKDILASAVPWDRVSGKPKLEILSGRFSDPLVSNEADNGIWFKNTIDGKNMCIKFAVSDKAFHFTLADDDGNPVLTKSFNFATLAQQDIIDICV